MKGITLAAKRANGLSRMCSICPIKKGRAVCPPEIQRVCSDAFVDGFKKGVRWLKQIQKEKTK